MAASNPTQPRLNTLGFFVSITLSLQNPQLGASMRRRAAPFLPFRDEKRKKGA
jgi:hypothetical protein